MKVKVIKLKRLWNNLASTRDYVVNQCIKEGLTLRFECGEEYMEIPPNELSTRAFKTNGVKQLSRFGKDYYLIDFAWRPHTKGNIVQESLF